MSALAAEFALGLAAADDRVRALRLHSEDPQFRAEVAAWAGRFTPLFDEVAPVAPPSGLLARVESAIGFLDARPDPVALRRSRNIWRGFSLAATGIAAALAIVLVNRPDIPDAGRSSPAPMIAMLGADQGPPLIVATWSPAARKLTVTPEPGAADDDHHSRELWVIPAGGTPHSMGTMPKRATMQAVLDPTAAALLAQGVTLAVSVEPPGGSTTGQPTGRVIASGKLQSA
ncbi:MAG: anti-sigma factor [Sphingomicrobium sp.]